jgi:hypothetical protein
MGSALGPVGPTLVIYGDVLQILDDGLLISARETNSVGTERIPDGTPVLIVRKFPGFCDGDRIQAVGKLAGVRVRIIRGAKELHALSAGPQFISFLSIGHPNRRFEFQKSRQLLIRIAQSNAFRLGGALSRKNSATNCEGPGITRGLNPAR